ncbi:MAG: hypothetical protein CLLPBCKN_003526 [Chroococcidiopsis cubana SAG 39.79]|jgi:hypothetical protein|uniref:Uncharacterized protein n=2 Tax=Chroococcidiopsis TaxID=54298 RepID=K9TXY2_CHRTP|nr:MULTISPECIES: hypothetical protein [Chroococcidiopsis]PSB49289.1 hypothetical protein C7B80_02235 [Cyanosarcina cf. burmensis CCALA 770]AFY86844.1 hypothetical protein Chro_1318 [Chroococcidiopsis thermalis PCC 7203]MDZ4874130.1 hypothetical protein [Chroococcidiopsis cubana SAG 39.79]PSB62247.1 hypothetical protein C7B79_18795 [Chroococcidiopsis cubana CCALA 043]RUT12282.1 hypothetical protein DSM107010_24960 [Chroococcidiopsis cubana SAG 39.79]
MKLSKLALFACPTLMALILIAPDPAQAREIVTQPNDTSKSVSPPLVDIVFDRPTPKPFTNVTENPSKDEVPTLDFTDEESQAAIQRYGCDCSSCIVAVQQLQGKLPL